MGVFKNPRRGKRGKKWGINYRDASGKQHQRIISNSKDAATKELRRIQEEIDRGSYLHDGGMITLGEYAASWLIDKEVRVRPSTWRGYRSHVNHITSSRCGLASVRLRALNLPRLRMFLTDLNGDEKGLKPKTVNSILTTLGSILEEAIRDGHLVRNPIRSLQKLPVPHREMDFLRPEEIPNLLEVAEALGWDLYVAVSLSIFSGGRRSETLGLRFEDFDFTTEYPVVRIRRTYHGNGRFEEPKTKRSRREINLCSRLQRLIAKHRLRRGNPDGSSLIFDRGDGLPLDPDHLSRGLWKRLLRMANLRESLRWHDMRHTFASILLNQGVNIKAISELMGHSSIQITMDRYGHLLPSTCQNAVDVLEKAVFEGSDVDNALTKEVPR